MIPGRAEIGRGAWGRLSESGLETARPLGLANHIEPPGKARLTAEGNAGRAKRARGLQG
jgi:hypothetical protein